MKCPKCNAEIAADIKFCAKCGARIQPKQSIPSVMMPADSNATTVLSDAAPQYTKSADSNATTVLSDAAPQYTKSADSNATTVLSDAIPQYTKPADPNATTVLSDAAPQYTKPADPNATTVLSDDMHGTPVPQQASPKQTPQRQVAFASRNASIAPPVASAQSPTHAKDNKKTLLIVLIVIGVMLLLAAIAGVLLLCVHRCEICEEWFFGKAYDVFGYVADKDCYREFFGLNF